MKSHKFILFFSFFIGFAQAQAEVLRWPQSCFSGQLQITNLKTTATRIWLQKFNPGLVSETELALKASGLMTYNLKATSSSERYAILNLGAANSIDVQFSCNKKIYPAHALEGGNLTYRKTDLPQNQIWLQNLYTGANTVLLEFQSRRFETMSSVTLPLSSLAHQTYTVPTSISGWSYIKISATQRYVAFNLDSVGAQGPLLINPQSSAVDTKASYFLVAPREGTGDSYIAKITDPAMIQKARDQISNPGLEKILFAKIKKDPQSVNRNWSKREKSFWSWSVSEVTNFADIGSSGCNGIPQALEDRVDNWIKDPAQICFWNYRVKKELSPSEVASGSPVQ